MILEEELAATLQDFLRATIFFVGFSAGNYFFVAFSGGNYFPTQASVRGSIDQAGKWVSGQGEGGEKSIFQVFPIYTLLLRNQFA